MAQEGPRYNVEIIDNPDQETLRALTLEHTPAVKRTAYGNLDKISRNKARMAKYTYVIAPEAEEACYSGKVIDPGKAAELIAAQRAYIEKRGRLIEIDGYLGIGAEAVAVRWLYTPEGANIAGMQQILAFPRARVEPPAKLQQPFEPHFYIVYTPNFFAESMPGRQAIIVDLERWTTYIMGPDYFGESKKAALRMLNDWVYRKGGLVLHAGAKAVHFEGRSVTMTIMGLSGTGKTTTTFSKQGELTQPIQDDMVVLWPGGKCTITENGCFAKTFGLSPETEPVIYHGTTDKDAWLENVYLNEDGTADFFKEALSPEEVARWREIFVETGAPAENVDAYIEGKVAFADIVDEQGIPKDGWDFVVWTQNGRSIIPISSIENAADFDKIPPVALMGILNRDEGRDAATPGIVRFTSPEQAAGYFMLGETSKTSAAGKERGKTRSPFTQPFFPRAFGLQAIRFSELARTMPDVDMWMMNTGFVGGDARDVKEGRALKVKIPHSSAMLEALISKGIVWRTDPDFGYDIVDVDHPGNAPLLEKVPREILNPRLFFEQAGRLDEYGAWVRQMKGERRAFLERYEVAPGIVRAVVNE